MASIKIAVIVGSARRGSINRKLALALIKLGADGAEFSHVDIAALPMFNQDLETDLPQSVERFQAEIAAADGLMFVTPEHNRSVPALLKNAIDWGTRPWGKNVWKGKPAAIAGASRGARGTAAAQRHMRHVMGGLGAVVMEGEACVTFKPGLVDDAGNVTAEPTQKVLKDFVDRFLSLAGTLPAVRSQTS